MSRSVDSSACGFVDEQLDAYFDGELGELDRVRVERHLTHCAACAETLAALELLRDDLRFAHPPETCPPEVTATVLAFAQRDAAAGTPRPTLRERLAGLLAGLVPTPSWRPALAGAAAALILAVPLWFTLRGPRPAAEPGSELTAAELAQAEKEARMVLALVASIGEDAGDRVREEILTNRIVEPTRRAFGFGGGPSSPTEHRP